MTPKEEHSHSYLTIDGVGNVCTQCGYPRPEPDPRLAAAQRRADEAEAALRSAMSSKEAPAGVTVTREHRLIAYQIARGIHEPPLGSRARDWVDNQLGEYRDWERGAQAIADAEARGAQASAAEVELLRAELAELKSQANEYGPAGESKRREQDWEAGYGDGYSDARFARWGTHPNPHSTTAAVLAKQAKAKARSTVTDEQLAADLERKARSSGWSEGYERAMNDRDDPNWRDTPATKNPHWRLGDEP